jgi:outer membrane protein OmpA-like peptidoglycan-associated protein
MAINLIDIAREYLTPDVTSNIAKFAGESTANTQKAMGVIVPSLMGAACHQASTPAGVSKLLDWVSPGNLDYSNILSGFGTRGGMALEDLARRGSGLVSALLGSRASGFIDMVAKASGVPLSSASSLINLAAPLVLGMIGKQVATEGLTQTGLGNLFSSHRDQILQSAPGGLARALGVSNMNDVCGAPAPMARPMVAATAAKQSSMAWLWLLPLLFALGLLAWRPWNTSKAVLASLKLPCGTVLQLEQAGFNYSLGNFLMKPLESELPKRFVFDHLNFDFATTQLTADSTKTVADLAAILKCFPTAQVELDGHTDNVGDPAANKVLSVNRANVVKDLLVQAGVDPNRIATGGFGEERPIASNDTEEGRAKNRRTELTVTSLK